MNAYVIAETSDDNLFDDPRSRIDYKGQRHGSHRSSHRFLHFDLEKKNMSVIVSPDVEMKERESQLGKRSSRVITKETRYVAISRSAMVVALVTSSFDEAALSRCRTTYVTYRCGY